MIMKGDIALSEKTNNTKPTYYYSMFHDKDIDFLHVSLYTLTANKIRTLHFHRVIEIGKCIKGGREGGKEEGERGGRGRGRGQGRREG